LLAPPELCGCGGIMSDAGANNPKPEQSDQQSDPTLQQEDYPCQPPDTISGIIYRYQLSADGTDRFTYVNQQVAEHIGYSPAQVMENPQLMWATILPEDRGTVERSVQQSAQHLTTFEVEYRARNRLGEVRWYAARSMPERQTDGSILWSGLIVDVSDRRLAEIDCLQALHDLRQLNALPDYTVANTQDLTELIDCLYQELQPPETVPPPADRIQPATLLLAEDNAENIDIFSTYLNATGYQVLSARNGEEAVVLSKEHHPDLILMDIQMPRMDGFEAIRQIRLEPALQSTPILTLTARAMPGDRERCFAVGANEYLSKPIQLKYLTQRLKYWLQRTRVRRS
jgi:PAS domain S-box-containing protein